MTINILATNGPYVLILTKDVPKGVRRSMNGSTIDQLKWTAERIERSIITGGYFGTGTSKSTNACWVHASDLPPPVKTESAMGVVTGRYSAVPITVSALEIAEANHGKHAADAASRMRANDTDRGGGPSKPTARESEAWSATLRAKVAASDAARRERERTAVPWDPE